MTTENTFQEWAIVDVMGHLRFIGKVSEQTIAGHGFVRVDIPETKNGPAWSKLIGPKSIHTISPVTEEIARALASERTDAPVNVYDFSDADRRKFARLAGPGDTDGFFV